MSSTKKPAKLLTIFLLFSAVASAQSTNSDIKIINQIVQAQKNYFSSIKSLSYSLSQSVVRRNKLAIEKPSEILFTYCENDSRYKFDVKQPPQSDSESFQSYVVSFDGEMYYTLNREYGRLIIAKDKSKIGNPDALLLAHGAFFEPFAFLAQETWDDPHIAGQPLSLALLKKEEVWVNFSKRISNILLEDNGLLKFSVRGGYNHLTGSKDDFIVWLDTKSFYPVRWVRITSDKKVIVDVKVTNNKSAIFEGGHLLYPQKMSRNFHGDGFDYPFSDEPLSVVVSELNSVKVNQNDEEEYSIDPALAIVIYDADKEKMIAVPK